jgi:hypothetical protein
MDIAALAGSMVMGFLLSSLMTFSYRLAPPIPSIGLRILLHGPVLAMMGPVVFAEWAIEAFRAGLVSRWSCAVAFLASAAYALGLGLLIYRILLNIWVG